MRPISYQRTDPSYAVTEQNRVISELCQAFNDQLLPRINEIAFELFLRIYSTEDEKIDSYKIVKTVDKREINRALSRDIKPSAEDLHLANPSGHRYDADHNRLLQRFPLFFPSAAKRALYESEIESNRSRADAHPSEEQLIQQVVQLWEEDMLVLREIQRVQS